MKKTLMTLIITGVFLSLASIASADYAVSVAYGGRSHNHHPRWNYPEHHQRSHHAHNRGYYQHGYYFWPFPVMGYTRVITTYEPSPKEEILDKREKLGISDIIVLSKAGVSDDIIIERIAKTDSVYNLTVEEVETLRHEGVSARVVNFMLNTKR